MPLTPSSNYNTYAALLNKKQVWVIEIDTLSTKYTSGTFADITTSYKKLIKDIDINLYGLDLRTNTQNPTSGNFTLIDSNMAITGLIKDNNLNGLKVTIKHGFEQLAIADFLDVYPQLYIDDIEIGHDDAEYIFKFSDPMFNLANDLFRVVPATNLNGAMDSSTTTATVDDTSAFLSTAFTGFGAGQSTNTYIKIDNEIMLYTATTATTFTVTRGQVNTSAAAHSDNAKVVQCYVWGPGGDTQISEVIMNLLMTSDDGTNGEFDAGIDNFGLGIPKAKVNIDEIRTVSAETWSMITARIIKIAGSSVDIHSMGYFTYYQKQSATDLFSKLLSMINCAFAVGTDGKLTLRRADYFRFRSASNNLENKSTSIIRRPTISDRTIVNNIHVQFPNESTAIALNYTVDYDLRHSTSETAFGRRKPKVIEWQTNDFPILYQTTTYPNEDFAEWLFAEFLWLYGDLSCYIDIKSHFKNMKYTAGDMVGISENNLPDVGAGTRGLSNEPCLIISKDSTLSELNFRTISWSLLNRLTPPSALGNYATPDDDTATFAADNTWTLEAADAYIANPSGTNNYWKVKIQITPPGSGSAKRSWIDLSFKFMVNSATEATAGNKEYQTCRFFYDPSKSDVMTYELIFWLDIARSLQRIKMDWHDASESAGSGLRPSSVKMTGVVGAGITTNITETANIAT